MKKLLLSLGLIAATTFTGSAQVGNYAIGDVVNDFSVTDVHGVTHRLSEITAEGKWVVIDFFFTTCRTICPIMTNHMVQIQNALKEDTDVLLLSHTVTPKIDTVAQLKRYAKQKGVIDTKWHLVTGSKKEIYKLARKSYLAVKDTGDGGPYDMVHTENFMLIDKKRQIRGFYDGTQSEDIERLLEDIETLKSFGGS